MKRLWPILAIGCTLAMSAACNRPSESDCKKAIENIRRIYDADPASDAEVAAAVRSCQGNATKDSVRCFIESESMTELRNCEGDMFKKMFGAEPPPVETLGKPKPAPAPPAEPPAAPATAEDAGAADTTATTDGGSAATEPGASGQTTPAPAKADAPKPAAPKADAPKPAAPKADAPKADAPKTEAKPAGSAP